MPNQTNDNPVSNSQIRIPLDIELAGDVRRSIAKIFNNIMVKVAQNSQDTDTPVNEKEPNENE